MSEDLVDAIDEYNAAVDFRNENWGAVTGMKGVQDAADRVVEDHLKKFENALGYEA